MGTIIEIILAALAMLSGMQASPAVPIPDGQYAQIQLAAEDELCIDVVRDPDGNLYAEAWRGDPDTCEPIGAKQ